MANPARPPIGPTVKSCEVGPATYQGRRVKPRVVVDCGWGRLIFAHTFNGPDEVASALLKERPGQRDIAFYLRDPHVALALHPHQLFLDPSHTFRLWLPDFQSVSQQKYSFVITPVQSEADAMALNRIYAARDMVTVDVNLLMKERRSKKLCYLLAKDRATHEVIGVILGLNHRLIYSDPEKGSSIWSLAVDSQTYHPGVGEALIREIAKLMKARGCNYVDLSVLHDNLEAIALYRKLGFYRIPVFSIKTRNTINERLFSGPSPDQRLNPYATIIVNEARRRSIHVDVLDAKAGYLQLTFGGRSITCRESLSELTSAIAMSRCADKTLTRQLLKKAGLSVPAQMVAGTNKTNCEFLKQYQSIVIKPMTGEQGTGISVDIRTVKEMNSAIALAGKFGDHVILEQYVKGEDVRIVVINYEVVAAAVRRPPRITGTGNHTITQLIERQSQRRARLTGGESRIPMDGETKRCVKESGYTPTDFLPKGKTITVRKTANLHTGGTIHDVTVKIHHDLGAAAVLAAETLAIPVVGLDFIVTSISKPNYVIIEANERPGLANHEPQPTVERFIDLLFPQTKTPKFSPYFTTQ
ncbi:MAG: N-acetylglutaminylglutamine synthetase [Nitrospirales bacterium]